MRTYIIVRKDGEEVPIAAYSRPHARREYERIYAGVMHRSGAQVERVVPEQPTKAERRV